MTVHCDLAVVRRWQRIERIATDAGILLASLTLSDPDVTKRQARSIGRVLKRMSTEQVGESRTRRTVKR